MVTAAPALFLFPSPLLPRIRTSPLRLPRRPRRASVVAAQSNFLKVLQTALRVGKDATEAGANLVPDIVPRPIAKIAVVFVAASVTLFFLKSLLSTALFVLAMMGVIYFAFMAFNSKELSQSSGKTITSDEESLEEARKIMEKYK